MTNGLVAPQFGLVGDHDRQRKQQPHQPDTALPQAYLSPFLPQTVPTVIIRRRRLIETGAASEGKAASASVDEVVRPAVKTPKIYRLESSSAAGPISIAQPLPATPTSAKPPAETAPVEQTPPAAPRRRKRDTLRAPRLLSHVVFDLPEPEAAEHKSERTSPASAAVQLPDFSLSGDGHSDYEAVCRAIERVHDELKAALQARRFRALFAKSSL